MGQFFIRIFLALTALIALAFILRMDLKLLSAADRYFTSRYKRISKGFMWGIKLPTRLGEKIEYYFFTILGKEHYCNYSSWPAKIAIIISMFLFIAFLISNSFTTAYYSFQMGEETGLVSYLYGKPLLYYLHLITLAYLALIIAIIIDSAKMTGYYLLIRLVIAISIISLSTSITIISFTLMIVAMVFYLIYKLLVLFFGRRSRDPYRERKPSIFARHYYSFLEVRDQFHYDDIINDPYTEDETSDNNSDDSWKPTDDEFTRVFKD